MKLFTIGESICQGFMSAAGARTDLAFSTLIAEALGVGDYRYPIWPKGGLPLNIETLLRRIQEAVGPEVEGLEWLQVVGEVGTFLDEVEDYYEREGGKPSAPDPSGHDFFHNAAVFGFDVADAWMIDGDLCRREIAAEASFFFDDGIFAMPSASGYRAALTVLMPSRQAAFYGRSALGWMEHLHTSEGVENLILWLGSNNALATVVDLEIVATDDPGSNYRPDMPHKDRVAFNLWSPDHFEHDYRELMDNVHRVMTGSGNDWHAFVGSVPAVTIAPLAKGVGAERIEPDPFGILPTAKYFEYYTYFLFDEDVARNHTDLRITFEEAYRVDSYIAEYNRIIDTVLAEKNALLGVERYHLVDINRALLTAAYKRNDEEPTYSFPDGIINRPYMVDTRFYHASEQGELREGGLFSLDGVHPSAIGQGLIAHEFMAKMNEVRGLNLAVDWDAVYQSDDLYSDPLRMMPWVDELDRMAELFLSITKMFGRRPQSRNTRHPRDR